MAEENQNQHLKASLPEPVTCPACGARTEVGQEFCGQCGAPLLRVCPTCGAKNPTTHRFCGKCGNPLVTKVISQSTLAREERRWVTVLFADVSGFTAMSERMDPEDVKALADRCANRLSDVVRRFGGTVIDVVGDEVFAVFGVPVAHEDDAERAVRAALAMQALDLADEPGHPVKVHVGLNTGEGMAGWIGPEGQRDYTVMGDTTNTGARILSAATPGTVLVGEATYRETQGIVRYRRVTPISAKGKNKPVPAWEALEMLAGPKGRPLGTAPLIGRDIDLARLENMWLAVSRELQPHLVTILGEPGMGKSRLVAELEQRLPKEVTIWHGRCLPYGEAIGYWALAMALKEAAGILAEDEAEAARVKLDRLVTGISGLGSDPLEVARHLALLSGLDVKTDRSVSAGDQRVLHASVRRFLEAYAREHPLCLIFDDIHWADDALLDLIESVAARTHETSLLIVTEARPELMEKRTAWGRNVPSFTSMPLASLSESAERDLILSLCTERGVSPELAAQIGHSPGGNPLFAEEMVAMMAEGGAVTGIPSVIKMLIAARLDTLVSAERTVVQLAAIFGKVFWKSGLLALNHKVAVELDETLEVLQQKNLLRANPRSQIRGDDEYAFKHDLIRDVAYEMLPKAERRSLHGQAADWLEHATGDQIENYFDQLAHHAVQAGQQERGIHYLVRAAERAGQAAAHRRAAALLGQAVALAESLDRPDLLADLHTQRGKAFMGVGMWEDVRSELEAALTLLGPERLEERVQILLDLGATRFWLLDIPSLRRESIQALELAEKLDRDDLAAASIANLSAAEGADGNLQESEDLYQRALRRSGESALSRSPSHARLGLTLYWRGQSGEAISRAHRAVELAQGDSSTTMFTLPHLGLALAGTGQYTEATEAFEEARRFGREYEVWTFLARAIAMSAGFHLDVLDFAGNQALAEEARELGRSINFLPSVVSANIDLLFNLVRRQQVGQAGRLVDEVAAVAEKAAGFHGWLWRLRLAEARAEISLARGEWQEALQLAEKAISQSRARGRVKYHAFGLETRAGALVAMGRKDEAISDLRSAVELTRPTGDPAMFLRAAAALLDLEGDDLLLGEARSSAQRIIIALPNDEMRRTFDAAEPVRHVFRS